MHEPLARLLALNISQRQPIDSRHRSSVRSLVLSLLEMGPHEWPGPVVQFFRAQPGWMALKLLLQQVLIGVGLAVDAKKELHTGKHHGGSVVMKPSLQALVHPLTEFEEAIL